MSLDNFVKNVAGITKEIGELGAKGITKAGQAGYKKIEETVDRAKEDKKLQEDTKRKVSEANCRWQDAVSRLNVAVEDTKEALESLEKERNHIIQYQGARFQRLYTYSIRLAEESSDTNFSLGSSGNEFIDIKMSKHIYSDQTNPAFGGVAAGTAAAATAAGTTALFGTASTGASIAGLHGAAAINATLASLGGGSIATGGFGIVGGLTVLGGLLVIPGLAVGGYVWDKNIRQAYQKSVRHSEKVEKMIAISRDVQAKYKTAFKTIQATIYETMALNGFLDGLLNVFESDIITGTETASRNLCVNALQVSQRLLSLSFVTKAKEVNINADQDLRSIHDDLDRVKRDFGIYLSGLNEHHRQDIKRHVDEAVKKFHENMRKQYAVKPLENEELRDVFLKTFEWAQNEICIITPWITKWVVDDFMKDRMRCALARNVKIRIVYGIGDISSNQKGNKKDNIRNIKTEEMANLLLKTFARYGDRFSLKHDNTHGKLLICDDTFYVIGSFNFLSFDGDYTKNNVRKEIGDYSENKEMISVYKQRFFNF